MDRLETASSQCYSEKKNDTFTTDHGVHFPASKRLSSPACLGDIKEFDKDNLTPTQTSARDASFLYTSEAVANMVKTFDRTNLKSATTMDSSGADLMRQKVKVNIESFNRWCLANVEVKPTTPLNNLTTVEKEILTFDQTGLNKIQTPVKSPTHLYCAEKLSNQIRNFNPQKLSTSGWEETASGIPRSVLNEVQTFNHGELSKAQTILTSPTRLYCNEKLSDEIRNFNPSRRLSSTGWEDTASGLPKNTLNDIQSFNMAELSRTQTAATSPKYLFVSEALAKEIEIFDRQRLKSQDCVQEDKGPMSSAEEVRGNDDSSTLQASPADDSPISDQDAIFDESKVVDETLNIIEKDIDVQKNTSETPAPMIETAQVKKKKRNKKKSKPASAEITPSEIVKPSCNCGVAAAGPRLSKTRKNKQIGREYYYCGKSKSFNKHLSTKGGKSRKESQLCDFILWVDEV